MSADNFLVARRHVCGAWEVRMARLSGWSLDRYNASQEEIDTYLDKHTVELLDFEDAYFASKEEAEDFMVWYMDNHVVEYEYEVFP